MMTVAPEKYLTMTQYLRLLYVFIKQQRWGAFKKEKPRYIFHKDKKEIHLEIVRVEEWLRAHTPCESEITVGNYQFTYKPPLAYGKKKKTKI